MRRGRHSRSRWEWGSEPARSNERITAITAEEQDPAKRAPGRKDKKAHCKQTHGPHIAQVVIRINLPRPVRCGWVLSWDMRKKEWTTSWSCYHDVVCSACGKVLGLMGECPAKTPVTPAERRALDEEIIRRMEDQERYRTAKPVIAGPQSYRRSRG
jgi:hypothetical protein